MQLNKLEQNVLTTEVGRVEPRLVVRSTMKVDAGHWWRNRPLWLLVLEDELVLLTAGRRRYVQRIPLEECRETHYCHDSGSLVISPAEELRFHQLRMPVAQGIKVLRLMGIKP